jgi:hypothetical protein
MKAKKKYADRFVEIKTAESELEDRHKKVLEIFSQYRFDRILDEVYRVLKLGGLLFLSTPNLASIHNRIALLLGYQPFNVMVSLNKSVGHLRLSASGAAPDNIRFFTLRSLKELLKVHGFKI